MIKRLCEKYLYPDGVYPSIYDIDAAALLERGISGLILDIDNTLKPPGRGQPSEQAIGWLDGLRDMGFAICLLSNSTRGRVARFTTGLGLFSVTYARKPAKAGFQKAVRLLGLGAGSVCVIGDQIFTDVLGAKRLGLMALYTRPITKKEEPTVRAKRLLEHFILKWRG